MTDRLVSGHLCPARGNAIASRRQVRPLPNPSGISTSPATVPISFVFQRNPTIMIDAAIKALSQILSPPMRSILWRSIGLALALIAVVAIGLQRLLSWFATYGEGWAEATLGPSSHMPLDILAWIVSIAAGLGIVFGAVLLMPAVTSLVAGIFVDEVADHVEREYYPAEQPGTALPFMLAMVEGLKISLLTVLVYLIALPFVLLAGAGFLVFFIATAWLLGRQYFELAAMRFRPPEEAKAMRRQNATTIFAAGLVIAAFVSIPIVNLATPLFGMAFMVHMHKRLSGPQRELIDPSRKTRLPAA
jgi:CysZ protein